MKSPYQLMPPLTEDELNELRIDIGKRGVMVPVEYDEEGNVLDGHHRKQVCEELGIDDFPTVIRSGMTEEEKRQHVRKLNLARRHLTQKQKREIVADALKDEPEKSNRQHGRELGVDDKTVGSVRDDLESTAEIPQLKKTVGADGKARTTTPKKSVNTTQKDIDEIEAIREQSPEIAQRVTSGELKVSQAKLELKRQAKREELANAEQVPIETEWRIINDDCLNALNDITPGSVRLIFADPPYNIGIDYGRGKEADRLPDDQFVAWCCDWIEHCYECLTPDGSLWLMISDEFAAEIAVALKDYGFHRRAWIKWYETFGVNCANNFNRTSRHIFYCVKNPKKFVFHPDAVTRPSDRQTKYNDKRAAEGGKIWDDVWQIPRLTGTSNERIPDFPTQVPLAITRAIVGCASDPGDTVLDPFSGSGSTGVAAIERRRNYIGIEWSEEFCELSIQRLKGVSHGD